MSRIAPLLLLCASLAACSAPGGPYPSLQPRAAEAIDPRVPVPEVINERPATAELVARLRALVDQARQGDAVFERSIAVAQNLAAAAGPAQSESWITAEQALSAAEAARALTAHAQGDIDALAAERLAIRHGIAPNDLKAIDDSAAEVGAIAARQRARLAAIRNRLGL